MRPQRAGQSGICQGYAGTDLPQEKLARETATPLFASTNYIPSAQSITRLRLECSYLSTNNFYAPHAPQERGSTLEKVSLLPERTLLRRSFLHQLQPMPGLLPRNPCHSPTSDNCPLKPR